jgi:FdhD protein
VGRHNALDKLIGASLRKAATRSPGFIVMTSRCSFELVYKAVAAGASMLATISAPTSLALEWADALHLPLACRGSAGEIILFDVEKDRADR